MNSLFRKMRLCIDVEIIYRTCYNKKYREKQVLFLTRFGLCRGITRFITYIQCI